MKNSKLPPRIKPKVTKSTLPNPNSTLYRREKNFDHRAGRGVKTEYDKK